MTNDNWVLIDSFKPSDFAADCRVYRQKSTGLLFFWAKAEDPELFGAFCFPTHPEDSSGAPHILEHTVLCGSQRFPGTATFFELSRGSLSSFLNAMTYPATTIYPFASPHAEDFRNLFEVYTDAVFFPLLREASFLQEGWRLQRVDGRYDITGVVYNEMRGDAATLESLISDKVSQNLWTRGPHSVNSGGDPLEIPKLSYEGLRDFHRRWYHPSHAVFYLYGKVEPDHFLKRLDELLREFEPRPRATAADRQVRRTEPRQLVLSFPAENVEAKNALVLGWLAEDVGQGTDEIALDLLTSLLMGEGGLLKQTVLESGLAEDTDKLTDRVTQEREGALQFGFSGVDPKNLARLRDLIDETLSGIAAKGLEAELIEAEIEHRNFQIREAQKHQGLRLLRRLAKYVLLPDLWPQRLSRLDQLSELKDRFGRDPNFWGELIRRYLLENPHRVEITAVPDPDYMKNYEQRRQQTVKEALSRMGDPDRVHRRQSALLQDLSLQPAAVNLPTLGRNQLPREIQYWPLSRIEGLTAPIYLHETDTLGISYIDVLWELGGLSPDDYGHLGLLTELLGLLDLRGMPYERHVNMQKLLLGSFSSQLVFRRTTDLRPSVFLRLRFSFRNQKAPQALDLVKKLLLEIDWESRRRLRESMLEIQHSARSLLSAHGNMFATSRAQALHDPLHELQDRSEGLDIVHRILHGQFDPSDRLSQEFEKIWAQVLNSPAKVLWTTDAEGQGQLQKEWPSFSSELFSVSASSSEPSLPKRAAVTRRERYLYQLDSAFNALAVAFAAGLERAPVAELFDAHLGQVALHRLHRELGGAYGVSLHSHPLSGISVFSTYRDPRVGASFADFRRAVEDLARQRPDQEELDRTLQGVIGDLIAPIPPKERGYHTLIRELCGLDWDTRQFTRDRLFEISPEDLGRFAEELLDNWGNAAWVSVAGKEVYDADPVPGMRDFLEQS